MTASSSSSISDTFQNSFYVGINIENILYGIELVLYLKTMAILLNHKGALKKSNLFYALFSSVMVFSVTVWVATSAIFGQNMWLLDSDFPGGPDAYWSKNISAWYMDWSMTAVIILQLMTDGLMIYRCWIMWDSNLAVVVPSFLWFATLVLGVLVDWASSSPGGDFFTGVASQLGLAYYTVSVFLNTTLTCMICYCIVRHGRKVREHLGHEYASSYFAVATLVVESVLPYTLSGIAFLVSLGVGSPTSVAFISVYFLMMCISPQMLILRVIVGRAWDSDTFKGPSSTVKFSIGGASGFTSRSLEWTNSNGARVHMQALSNAYLPDGHSKVVISQV
ncbi:hypothetical protein L210DRAFT_3476449 [Boletus edulis BED1]|uniref:Transmembrane protein n=1 Tax=Boletus edulis BED1 TaxID=1328754 RepID=A0AAD4BZX3_BOLED|nr:hypothetical protein L210DRAFT_3476449 [Boletus edulis BED1]